MELLSEKGCSTLDSCSTFSTVILFALWCSSFAFSWTYSLSSLLFFIPVIFLISWWSKNTYSCNLNHIIKNYMIGFFYLTIISVLLQILGLFALCFLTYITSVLYVIFGVLYYISLEEILKLWFAMQSRKMIDPMNLTKAHLFASISNTLGYSTAVGLIWLALIAHAFIERTEISEGKLLVWLIIMNFVISSIGMPMHILSGYYIGIKITQIDMVSNNNQIDRENTSIFTKLRSNLGIVKLTILFRSVHVYLLIVSVVCLEFNLFGVLLVFFGTMAEYFFFIKIIKNEEQQLPFDYLQRVGQLNILGYGMLPGGPLNDDINNNNNIKTLTNSIQNISINNDEIDNNNDINKQQNQQQLTVPYEVHDDDESDDPSQRLVNDNVNNSLSPDLSNNPSINSYNTKNAL